MAHRKNELKNHLTLAATVGFFGMMYMLLIIILNLFGLATSSSEGMQKIHFFYDPSSFLGIISSLIESFISFFAIGVIASYVHKKFFIRLSKSAC